MIKDPAAYRIGDLAQIIRHAKEGPLDEIKEFKRALDIAKLPKPVRRLLWWLGFSIGRFFGTVVLSTVSAFGADLIHPIAVTPFFLTYGIIGADAPCRVRLIFDHRVLDGVAIARALVRLEAILNTAIIDELRGTESAVAPTNTPGTELHSVSSQTPGPGKLTVP
jgi:hypothetical protein